PKCGKAIGAFLTAFGPEQVIPVSGSSGGADPLGHLHGHSVATTLTWNHGPCKELWTKWFPRAEQVVVCRAEPRRLLLQAACLGGALRAPLWVLQNEEGDELKSMVAEWHTRRVLAVGLPASFGSSLGNIHIIRLPDEEAVASLALRHLEPKGPLPTLVVA